MKISVFLLAFGMFVCGVIAQKNHYIPDQVRGLEARLKALGVHPEVVLAGQYSRNNESLTGVREVDTALLPLQVRRSRLSDVLPAPRTGGAITTIGNKVIVLDRLGNLYLSLPGGKRFSPMGFPPLPNNVTYYLKTPRARVDENTFRAYDIEYVKSDRMLVVSHEAFDRQIGKSRLTVSTIAVDEQTLKPTSPWTTIFQADPEVGGPNVEAGGRLTSKGDRLYLTIGGYDLKSEKVLDDPACDFGTIVELDPATHGSKIVSRGHRNAEGLAVTSTGEILSTEHGPSGGDELNLIREGADYGWPNVTLGTDYGKYSWRDATPVGEHRGYQPPMFAWVPSVGLSNLIQVSGFDPRWDGDLLVGSLKAASLFRMRLEKDRVMYVEPIWIGQRVRDIAQMENGTIAVWTDDTQLLFISVDHERLDQNVRPNKQANSAISDACLYCHHFGPTNPSDFAPTLSGLFDRRIASDNYRYSAGLRNKDGEWTEEALRQFLNNPAEFANGTAMPKPNLYGDQLEEVIEGLKRNSDSDNLGSRKRSRELERVSRQ
jgi:cytochrome c2